MSQRKGENKNKRFEAVLAKIAGTRDLDRLDVLEGRIPPEALWWFPPEFARNCRVVFPPVYQKTSPANEADEQPDERRVEIPDFKHEEVVRHSMTRLLLDCEWADSDARELVSLGMVSDDGRHRFYAEMSPLPERPTEFVREVVYPLLEHGEAARQAIDFTRDLRVFLAAFHEPFVLFDYPTDGVLFDRALAGFDLPDAELAHLPLAPKVNKTLLLHGDVQMGIERYFEQYPEARRRRHHAGVDAEALRWAFCEALKG